MENIEVNTEQLNQPKSERWFAGYIVAGLIWTFAQSFIKSTVDQLVVLIVAIAAGFFYHRIKVKVKIKNEFIRIVVTFFIIEIITGFIIGLLTSIV